MGLETKMKVYNSQLEEMLLTIDNEQIFINQENKGTFDKITYTVYTTGEVLTKTPRNYFNIHIYDYLYNIIIKLNDGTKYSFYVDNKKDILREFTESKIKYQKYQLSFFQKNDLPIVAIEERGEKILLKELALFKEIKYLYQKFPKITFYTINITGTKFEEKELAKFAFEIRSATNFYKRIFTLVIIISCLFFIVNFNRERERLIFLIILFFMISLMLLLIYLINLLEKNILKKFVRSNK